MLTTIIIIIFIIIVFFIYKVIKKRNSPVSRINQTYTLFEILSPFDPAPKEIYKHLSPENKGAFWNVITSIIVAVLTCWLGFTVQFFVIDSTKDESKKIAHYQVVDKFRPKYIELVSDTSTLFILREINTLIDNTNNEKMSPDEFLKLLNSQNKTDTNLNTPEAKLFNLVNNKENQEKIHRAANKCMEICSDIAFYLDYDDRNKIIKNNSLILLGSQIYATINDSIHIDSISYTKKYIDQYIVANIMYDAVNRTYTTELIQNSYSISKNLKYLQLNNPISYNVGLARTILQFYLLPTIDNIKTLSNEFNPQERSNKIIRKSILLLIFCIFIGYMIGRIIIMIFFDRKSLTPNPKMSQDDLNKLNRENELLKRFNCQNEINNRNLLNQLQITEKKLEKECDLNKKNEKRINELILELEKFKERPIKDEEPDNKEL